MEKLQAEKKGIPTDFFTENNKRYMIKKGRFGEYLESEDYENDQKRMSLPLPIKQKLKKGTLNEINGILQINDEITTIINEDKKIIEEAGVCEKCGRPFEIKMGRFGKFLACTGYPECKNIRAIPKSKSTPSKKKTTAKKTVAKKIVEKETKKSREKSTETKSTKKKITTKKKTTRKSVSKDK